MTLLKEMLGTSWASRRAWTDRIRTRPPGDAGGPTQEPLLGVFTPPRGRAWARTLGPACISLRGRLESPFVVVCAPVALGEGSTPETTVSVVYEALQKCGAPHGAGSQSTPWSLCASPRSHSTHCFQCTVLCEMEAHLLLSPGVPWSHSSHSLTPGQRCGGQSSA